MNHGGASVSWTYSAINNIEVGESRENFEICSCLEPVAMVCGAVSTIRILRASEESRVRSLTKYFSHIRVHTNSNDQNFAPTPRQVAVYESPLIFVKRNLINDSISDFILCRSMTSFHGLSLWNQSLRAVT